MLSVGSRYFDAIGVSLIRGRAFTSADGGPGRQIAIVNQRLADLYFKGLDPSAGSIRLSQDGPGNEATRMADRRRRWRRTFVNATTTRSANPTRSPTSRIARTRRWPGRRTFWRGRARIRHRRRESCAKR